MSLVELFPDQELKLMCPLKQLQLQQLHSTYVKVWCIFASIFPELFYPTSTTPSLKDWMAEGILWNIFGRGVTMSLALYLRHTANTKKHC